MNIRLQMIDVQTGEILATSYKSLALNFGMKNDTGFNLLQKWCESAVRGVRTTKHEEIEVRFYFGKEKQPESLNF